MLNLTAKARGNIKSIKSCTLVISAVSKETLASVRELLMKKIPWLQTTLKGSKAHTKRIRTLQKKIRAEQVSTND